MFESLQPVVQDFLVTLVTGLLAIFSGFLIALAKKGFDWLSEKISTIKNDRAKRNLNEAISHLQVVVTTTVTALQQTLGDDIKESIKKQDNKFTIDDLISLKDRAVSTVMSQLTDSSKEILSEVYSDLESFVQDMIEEAVRNLKTAESAGSVTSKVLLG